MISVVIPSRLEGDFLAGAIHSIYSQEGIDERDVQIIVGVDSGTAYADISKQYGVEIVESAGHSQSAALNAAVTRARGDYIAFLEDDDTWNPAFLRVALATLVNTEFVSSTQLEVDKNGDVRRINDFPTPSGWIMQRKTFDAVGKFDESYRWHMDNNWLGRLGEAIKSRVHLVESTAPLERHLLKQVRPWLENCIKFGRPEIRLVRHSHTVPLVTRRVHAGGGMKRVERDAALKAESEKEISRLIQRFGRIPW